MTDLDRYLEFTIDRANSVSDRSNQDAYFHLAHGRNPYWENGSYAFREFRGQAFRIADQRQRIARVVKQWVDQGDDVYVCPYPRYSDKRIEGNALLPTMLHVDLDGEPAGQALFDTLNPLVVSSGRNRHLYVPLTKAIDLGTWRRMQIALRDRLGGDDKIASNDLLRLPGTFNHKPATPGGPPGIEYTGTPAPVVILDGPTA